MFPTDINIYKMPVPLQIPQRETGNPHRPSKQGSDICHISAQREKEASSFTPLAEQVAHAAGNAEESVEEFFDEEDCSEEEPPIQES